MTVYVLYENPAWLPPLIKALDRAKLDYELWSIVEGNFDLGQTPPEGVYLNRISPSSHTRNHAASVNFTWELLAWLESHGRTVINGSRAFALEISKVRQYEALRRGGIAVPHTVAVAGGPSALKDAADQMRGPFITKHNRGGKGLGVRLFHTPEAFEVYVDSRDFEVPVDHITLLQEYVRSPEPFITRVELVGDRFLYAIRSDTSQGFELCPADGCQPGQGSAVDSQSIFSLREGFDDPLIDRYLSFMKANDLDVAGIEFIEDEHGNKITYDVNGTTNYSPSVEAAYGLDGMGALVAMIQQTLCGNEVLV